MRATSFASFRTTSRSSPAGSRLKGLCPFHHEKTPSFSVDPQMQLFYCFGCQAGGDAFKFVMLYEKLDFPESVEFLAKRWGVPLPEAAARPEDDARARLLLMNEAAAGFFRGAVVAIRRADEPARDYIAARGVSDAVAERFGLGYAPDGWDALVERPRRARLQGARASDRGPRDPAQGRVRAVRSFPPPGDLPDSGRLRAGCRVRRPRARRFRAEIPQLSRDSCVCEG